MDVATPREIHLAFYSLIKMFASVDVEQKSLSWNAQPLLPGNIKAEDVQQVRGSSLAKLRMQTRCSHGMPGCMHG
jgi:hypothetical protein